MKSNKHPLSRKSNIVVQETGSEVLIYDLGNSKAFCLNETSALVWQACDGDKSITEITEFVGKKLNSKATEDLVWLAIDQLNKDGLIENGNELSSPFQGMARREVIKRVGLGTMLMLPVVAGMVTPVSAQALSCQIDPCTCQTAVPLNTLNCVSLQCAPAATGCICKDFGGVVNGVANAANCTDLGGGLFACSGRCSR